MAINLKMIKYRCNFAIHLLIEEKYYLEISARTSMND